jgi:Spy/CpxP family protein refolding chaperone
MPTQLCSIPSTRGSLAALYAAATLPLLAAGGALLLVTPPQAARAQESASTETKKSSAALQQLATDLNLTDDQKAKSKNLLSVESKLIKSVAEDSSLSRSDKASKISTIHQKTKTGMSKILTADQNKKLDEELAKYRKAVGEHIASTSTAK